MMIAFSSWLSFDSLHYDYFFLHIGVFIVVMYMILNDIWKTYLYSYIYGIKKPGIIKKIRFDRANIVKIYVVDETVGNGCWVYAIGGYTLRRPDYLPKVGDEISYYYVDDNKYGSNPDIQGYMKKICLKKSMLKEM